MKLLRDIPGLLKRHYEKVLLAFALVGLIAAVVILNNTKSKERETLEQYERGIPRRANKPIKSVDISELQSALARATNPHAITFAPPHNLFNAVKWQRRPDGSLVKVETGKEVGPEAMEVVKITPLHLHITLDQQSGSGVNMSVFPETNRLVRAKIQSFITTNSASERIHRTRFFTLRDLKITPEGPVAEIELADGTKANVTTNKPFSRIEGYKADLKYSPENRNLPDRRVSDSLTLAGEEYNIVAINPNEVVVSARSNDRRFNIRNNAAQQ
jgi:hypothetical protein